MPLSPWPPPSFLSLPPLFSAPFSSSAIISHLSFFFFSLLSPSFLPSSNPAKVVAAVALRRLRRGASLRSAALAALDSSLLLGSSPPPTGSLPPLPPLGPLRAEIARDASEALWAACEAAQDRWAKMLSVRWGGGASRGGVIGGGVIGGGAAAWKAELAPVGAFTALFAAAAESAAESVPLESSPLESAVVRAARRYTGLRAALQAHGAACLAGMHSAAAAKTTAALDSEAWAPSPSAPQHFQHLADELFNDAQPPAPTTAAAAADAAAGHEGAPPPSGGGDGLAPLGHLGPGPGPGRVVVRGTPQQLVPSALLLIPALADFTRIARVGWKKEGVPSLSQGMGGGRVPPPGSRFPCPAFRFLLTPTLSPACSFPFSLPLSPGLSSPFPPSPPLPSIARPRSWCRSTPRHAASSLAPGRWRRVCCRCAAAAAAAFAGKPHARRRCIIASLLTRGSCSSSLRLLLARSPDWKSSPPGSRSSPPSTWLLRTRPSRSSASHSAR